MLVTIDLDAYEQLPPRQLRAMLRALRFENGDGIVQASLAVLAMPGLSRSAVHRDLGELEDDGHLERLERPEGGFNRRIGSRFRSQTISRPSCRDAVIVPAAGTPVPQVGTPDSPPHVDAPALVIPSSDLRSSEGEQLSLDQREIPNGWKEAAAAERRLAGLPDVDLRVEWQKLGNRAKGQPITIWRWREWALKAWASKAPEPVTAAESPIMADTLPGTDQEKARARSWAKTGRWAPPGMDWGPAPDQPGCLLPSDLIAWCLRERAARMAA